jgi:EAL domain-containing protein (putative c-di-GMP-specific phosphodiesterase class I)
MDDFKKKVNQHEPIPEDEIIKLIIERLFKLERQNKEIITELKGLGFKISLPTL